jgi:hypothetical protein
MEFVNDERNSAHDQDSNVYIRALVWMPQDAEPKDTPSP